MKGEVHQVELFANSSVTIKKELMSGQYGQDSFRSMQAWTAWRDLNLDTSNECARANHL